MVGRKEDAGKDRGSKFFGNGSCDNIYDALLSPIPVPAMGKSSDKSANTEEKCSYCGKGFKSLVGKTLHISRCRFVCLLT